MSVYGNDVVDPSYRGCYSDPGNNRVFVQDASSDEMTSDVSERASEACLDCCAFSLA